MSAHGCHSAGWRNNRRHSTEERDHQRALIAWRDLAKLQHPELELLFAIPNAGAGASKGQGGKMKAEGAVAGVADLFFAIARGPFHGAFVEMKSREGRLSPAQLRFKDRVLNAGYAYHLAREWTDAKDFLLRYLEVLP